MTTEEQHKKIEEYSQRNGFWTNQVLSQTSYSINLFTTLGVAFLAYLIERKGHHDNSLHITFEQSVDWKTLIYVICVLASAISVLFGAISITSRLYDLRITRHLISTRKTVMKKKALYLSDHFIDVSNDSLFKNYFQSIFKEISFITKNDFDNIKQLRERFNSLRKQSKLLGKLIWKTHKAQILMLLCSCVLYSIKTLF